MVINVTGVTKGTNQNGGHRSSEATLMEEVTCSWSESEEDKQASCISEELSIAVFPQNSPNKWKR